MTRGRLLLVAAIAAGALYLVGAVALGTPPKASASAATVAAWVRDHESGVRTYAWTATFGTLAFAVAIALVAEVLPQPHRRVFLIGATAFVVENALQAWFWAGAALHAGNRSADSTQAIIDVARFWGPILTGTTITMIGAVTALGFGGGTGIPGWLTGIGIVAFAEQAVETITVFGKSGFTAPGGDMNLLLGAGLTAVWFFALVVWAYRRV